MDPLILVVNPGSSSRKYALYEGIEKKATIHFEYAAGEVIGTLEFGGKKYLIDCKESHLGSVAGLVMPLLHEHKVIGKYENVNAIGIRVVAPSKRFTQDELITSRIEAELEAISKKAPLHISTVLAEVKHLREYFKEVPIIEISDSAFHATKPKWASSYGIDTELADKYDIERFGYHGISVQSVVDHLKNKDMLLPKTIVCHIGSGSSITAVSDGLSVDTTMGYTPLEGLMMASRSGSIDVSAALAIKRELDLSDDELEEYLNKKSGLLGVSGTSNDIRELIESEKKGDERAGLALKMFVYRIQLAIGQMAASMGGVNCLVFTATIGERSFVMRERILDNLEYLGFTYDKEANDATFEPKKVINIAKKDSKPILIVPTDESNEIARRVVLYLESIK